MGKANNRPLSLEVKERNGTFVKNPNRRLPNAVRADLMAPPMPDYFDEDEELKWNELTDDLQSMGVISSSCRETMIAYCTIWGRWIKCHRRVKREGLVQIKYDQKGNKYKARNPVVPEMHKFRDQLNKLIPEMGLSPSSRGQLQSLKPQEEEDGFEILLARIGDAG